MKITKIAVLGVAVLVLFAFCAKVNAAPPPQGGDSSAQAPQSGITPVVKNNLWIAPCEGRLGLNKDDKEALKIFKYYVNDPYCCSDELNTEQKRYDCLYEIYNIVKTVQQSLCMTRLINTYYDPNAVVPEGVMMVHDPREPFEGPLACQNVPLDSDAYSDSLSVKISGYRNTIKEHIEKAHFYWNRILTRMKEGQED